MQASRSGHGRPRHGDAVAGKPDQADIYHARCLYFTRIGKPQDGLADCNRSLTLLPTAIPPANGGPILGFPRNHFLEAWPI